MSSTVLDNYVLPITTILEGIPSLQLLESFPKESILELYLPTFNNSFSFNLLSIKQSSHNRIKITANIEKLVSLFLDLEGHIINGKNFKISNLSFGIELQKQTPQAEFIASLLRAALVLENNLKLTIPVIEVDTTLKINLPINEVSQMLKRGQMAYKLMVIEKATNTKFQLPSFISANDLRNIDIVYNAITQHSFAWPIQTIEITLPANNQVFKLLPHESPQDFVLSDNLAENTILGNNIVLGQESLTIKDAITLNSKEIQAEMTSNDNHLMQVTIASLSGQGIYTYTNPPKLSNKSWNANISKLINLEKYLDKALADQYNQIACATLEGLSEQQKDEVTNNSFSFDDHKEEN